MKTLRKLLVFLLLVVFSFGLSSSENVSFDFSAFSLRNLTLLGDSYLRNGVVGLTREIGVPSASAGAVVYNDRVPFFDPESNQTASFSTCFSFSVSNINPTSYGDGLAFFLSPESQPLGSPGGYLGLVNSSRLTKNRFVAVEFDTRLDLYFKDPSDHHVGLDIDSLISIKTADPASQGIDLKSGDSITAWIDYRSDQKQITVFLSYTGFKPDEPLLTVDIDLSEYLKQFMYVGFSASTEGSTELHLLQTWRFQTSGFQPAHPRAHPHNVSDNSVTNPNPDPHPTIPVPGSHKHHNRVGLGLGIAGPAFFCAFLAVFGWVSVQKWKRMKVEKSFRSELVTAPRQFSYRELKAATRGFNSGRIIGHGAFGTVYKAYFADSGGGLGSVSAVKRSKHSHEGKSEFLAELSVIACLRHKNLVQLQGWCVEKGELLLVYEYMANGSLDKVLYNETGQGGGGSPLKWSQRYNIAVGLASVLTYLHQECEQQVIHRDIKTSNVMLDGAFHARLGDFGLARLMDHGKSPVSTLTAGTMGYLAPEYLQYGKATDKTDVFSYGVVVLEVACGKRPIEKEPMGQNMLNLVDWVWGLHSQGRIIEAADERLKGQFDEGEMRTLLMVGLSCVNPNDSARPTMRRVLQILSGEAELLPVPKVKPSLSFTFRLPLSLEEIVSDTEDMVEIEVN